MASQTFTLHDAGRAKTAGVVLVIVVVAIVGVLVGVYAFRSSTPEEGCSSPDMDPNGLSNFTIGADTIAFACFPGFFVDSTNQNGYVLSTCLDKQWIPSPPACNFLPLRLDCRVENHGLDGSISMIQMGIQNETQIFGFVKYEKAIKAEGHINEVVKLSRHSPSCALSKQYNISGEIDEIGNINETYLLKVHFESPDLFAFRTAEVHINMIYLDLNTTATLISVHQGNYTDVMKQALPSLGWNSDIHNKLNKTDDKKKAADIKVSELRKVSVSQPKTQPSKSLENQSGQTQNRR